MPDGHRRIYGCAERVVLRAADLDLIEANEAFAVQCLAVASELELPEDRANVNGGAVALGHPIGASGARILVTLLHEMAKRDARLGLATLCIGGGMGRPSWWNIQPLTGHDSQR